MLENTTPTSTTNNSKNAFSMGIGSNYEAQMRLARAKPMPSENDYHIEYGTKRVYHSPEAEFLARVTTATSRPFSNGNNNIHYAKRNLTSLLNGSSDSNKEQEGETNKAPEKHQSIRDYYRPNSKDADQSIFIARMAANTQMNQRQKQAPVSNISEDPAALNYDSDYQTAQMIATSLKSNELSSGKEYSSSELADLIRQRFKGVNDNIVKLAIDLLTTDVQDVNARVAGSNIQDYKLMYSARQPQQLQQQQQQNQNQQQQQQTSPNNPNNNTSRASNLLPPDLQAKINALSDSDKQLLQTTAQSVVNDILSQTSEPIPELDLERQITTTYNVSSGIADLIVEVLLTIPDYAKLITPQQNQNNQTEGNVNNNTNNPQANQQQKNTSSSSTAPPYQTSASAYPKRPTMQQQQQQNQQPSNSNNSNNTTSANDLSKKPFSGYKNMAQCLDTETQKNGLSHSAAVEYCSKSFKDHLKTHPNDSQQQSQQPAQQKTAASNNNTATWSVLRNRIVAYNRT